MFILYKFKSIINWFSMSDLLNVEKIHKVGNLPVLTNNESVTSHINVLKQ